jgi:hypothetical protein
MASLWSSVQILCDLPRTPNVALLAGLVATAQEDDHHSTPEREIEPVARSVGNAQLRDFVDPLVVTEIACGLDPRQPDGDL